MVDAIHRFAFVHHIHDPSAKKQLLHHMCSNRPDHTAPCTRDMALLLKATVHTGLDPDLFKDEDGKGKEGEVDDGMNENWFVFDEGPAVPSPLVVWENEEPADVIHKCVSSFRRLRFLFVQSTLYFLLFLMNHFDF